MLFSSAHHHHYHHLFSDHFFLFVTMAITFLHSIIHHSLSSSSSHEWCMSEIHISSIVPTFGISIRFFHRYFVFGAFNFTSFAIINYYKLKMNERRKKNNNEETNTKKFRENKLRSKSERQTRNIEKKGGE